MKIKTLVGTALSCVFAASCGSTQEQVETVQVKALQLKDTSCVVKVNYPAIISGIQDVAIFPQVSGRITAVNVYEGQSVKVGDVLFEIDDVPYRSSFEMAQAQVEVSKAQLETARLAYQSKKNLFDRDIISDYQLKLAANAVSTAKAVLGQSEAALRAAENNLSFTKVRTMGSGQIGLLPYKVGSLVGPNISDPLTMVSDNSSIYADFSTDENTQLELGINALNLNNQLGQLPLTLITNLGQEYPYKGKIHSVSGMLSSETGALSIRSVFPNPDRILLSGGSCKVQFTIERDSVIMVPRASMREVQNKLFVFVIKNGSLIQTPVRATRYNSALWMVEPDEDGSMPLHPGDSITRTTNRLKDGDQVEVIE